MATRVVAGSDQTDLVVIRVLGPTRADRTPSGSGVTVGVELGGRRPRRLLLALAVDAGRSVPADRLAERVWGAQLPEDARASLHTLVSRLRQALGADVIVTDGQGYRLAAGAADSGQPATLDALTFAALVAAAEQPDIGLLRRLELLDTALTLWQGNDNAYDEVAGEDWARPEAERLEELRLVVSERRFDAMLGAGKHTDVLPALASAVEQHPLRDRLVSQHMLALFRSGRQAEATRAFQAHRARLDSELGLEPSRELVELDRRIVAGDGSLHLDPAHTAAGQAVARLQAGRAAR